MLLIFLLFFSLCVAKPIPIFIDTEVAFILKELISEGNKPLARDPLILKMEHINAFATLGDLVAVYSGLICANSIESTLSALMHELGHLHHRHITTPWKVTPLSILSLPLLFLPGGILAFTAAQSLEITSMLAHSRRAEYQADQFSVLQFYRNNWPLQDTLAFFGQESDRDRFANPYLRTHPVSHQRLNSLKAFVRTICAQHNTTCFQKLLTRINDELTAAEAQNLPLNIAQTKVLSIIVEFEDGQYFLKEEEKTFLIKNTSSSDPTSFEQLRSTLRLLCENLQEKRLAPNEISQMASFVQKNAHYSDRLHRLYKILQEKIQAFLAPQLFLESTEHATDTATLYVRAWAFYEVGMPTESLQVIASIKETPLFEDTIQRSFLMQLSADAHQLLGNTQEAFTYAQKAYDLGPKSLLSSIHWASFALKNSPSSQQIQQVINLLDRLDNKSMPEISPIIWELKAKAFALLKKDVMSRYCLLEKAYATKSRDVFPLLQFFENNKDLPEVQEIEVAIEDILIAVKKHRSHYA